VVYHVPHQSVLNFIDGKQNTVISESSLIADKDVMQFNIYPYWWSCGLKENECLSINPSGKAAAQKNFLLFRNTRIVRIDSSNAGHFKSGAAFETDLVVLSGNVRGNLQSLLNNIKYKKLIIDSSNSMGQSTRWLKEAEAASIPCHSVLHSGAYISDLVSL
jgi:competence protein ComEC